MEFEEFLNQPIPAVVRGVSAPAVPESPSSGLLALAINTTRGSPGGSSIPAKRVLVYDGSEAPAKKVAVEEGALAGEDGDPEGDGARCCVRRREVPVRACSIANLMGSMKNITLEGIVLCRYGAYLNIQERAKNRKFCPFNADLVDAAGRETITVTCKLRGLADRFAHNFQVGRWCKLYSFAVVNKDPAYHHGDTLNSIELDGSSLVEPVETDRTVVIDFKPEYSALKTPLRSLARVPENYSLRVVAAVWKVLESPTRSFSFWIANGVDGEDTLEVKVFNLQHPVVEAIERVWSSTAKAPVFYFRNIKRSGQAWFSMHASTTFTELGEEFSADIRRLQGIGQKHMRVNNVLPREPITVLRGIPNPGTRVSGVLTVFSARIHDLALACVSCGGAIPTGDVSEQPCDSCFTVGVPKVCGYVIGELLLSRGGDPLPVRVPAHLLDRVFGYADGEYMQHTLSGSRDHMRKVASARPSGQWVYGPGGRNIIEFHR